jgi:NitT/TauT family transport system permease protein
MASIETASPLRARTTTPTDTDSPDQVAPDQVAAGVTTSVPPIAATSTGTATVAPSTVAPAAKLNFVLRALGRTGRAVIGVLLLIAVWEGAPRAGLVDRVFVPPLSEVLARWWELARSGDLWANTEASLLRAGVGFALALAIALPLGLVIGWFRPIAEVLSPVLTIFWNTAVLALLPVFVLLLGIGEKSKIAIVIYACLWPILLNTISGVQNVDPLLVKSAQSMGLRPARLFQKVILPSAVPTIFTGVRLSGAYSILVLVAAEMVGARQGLGFLILNAQSNFAITDMYAGIITIAGIGLVINQALLALERHFSRWRAPR